MSQLNTKKKIIIAFLILTLIGAVSAVALALPDSKQEERQELPQYSYDFHVADFDRDILKDAEYLELNRYIAYTEGATTVLITDGDYEYYGPVVEFFAEYIDAVIHGDHVKYNSFFSDEYIAESGEKADFTMQQLYDINLIYYGNGNVEIDGERVASCEVALDYMIRQNNGSFRNDMGSDAIRRQFITLIEREGALEIYSVRTPVYAN